MDNVDFYHRRKLTIDLVIDGYQLYPVRIIAKETLSEVFNYTITVITQAKLFYSDQLLGQTITLTVYDDNNKPIKYIHGAIAKLVLQAKIYNQYNKYSEYVITLVPECSIVLSSKQNEVFNNICVIELVKSIYARNNLLVSTELITKLYTKYDYLVQYDQSTTEFIQNILTQNGISYYYHHEPDKHILMLYDNNQVLANYHTELIQANKTHYDEHLHEWIELSKAQPVNFILSNKAELKPSHINQRDRNKHSALSNQQRVFNYTIAKDYVSEYSDDQENKASNFLSTLSSQLKYQTALFYGKSSYQTLKLGCLIKIDQQDDSYEMVQLNYEYTEPFDQINHEVNHQVNHDKKFSFSNFFIAIPSENNVKTTIASNYQNNKKLFQSLQSAKVLGVENNQVLTDQYARVKIKFYWDNNIINNTENNTMYWCFVTQDNAGDHRGSQWIPKINDEVMIGFNLGFNSYLNQSNYNHPIVLASAYTQDKPELYVLPEEKLTTGLTYSDINSQSSIVHELSFDDTISQEKITISNLGDKQFLTKKNHTQLVKNNITHTVYNQYKIFINAGKGLIYAKEAKFIVNKRQLIMNQTGIFLKVN